MKDGLFVAGLAASIIAAVLGVRAATVPIRDNIDVFIADLHRQGSWASWAAVAAAVSAGLQAFAYFIKS